MKCPADKLTRDYLEKRGYKVDKSESYNHHTKRKKDLFKFIDFVAIHPIKKEILAIQTTTKGHLPERIRKARGLEAYWQWLSAEPVEFHGWYKDGNRWAVKVVRVDSIDGEIFS